MIYAIDNKKRLVRKITKEEIVYFFNNNHSKRNRFIFVDNKQHAKQVIKYAMEVK